MIKWNWNYSPDGDSVEANCLKYRVWKDIDVSIEVDVLPPNIKVHPTFSGFLWRSIQKRKEDIIGEVVSSNEQLEKICSQSTKTDYLSLDSKTQGLSLTDLLNTNPLVLMPQKSFNNQDFALRKPTLIEKSRSRSASKRSMTVITLSSDEEDDDSYVLKPYQSRRRSRRLAK